jgi:palmitoyltransferase
MMFSIIFILSGVLCFAVGVMLAFHLWTVVSGETTVEAQDHEAYRRKATERGEAFVNSYNLGWRTNLEVFFNVGEGG